VLCNSSETAGKRNNYLVHVLTFAAKLRTALPVSFTVTFRLRDLPRNSKLLPVVLYVTV